MSTTSSLLRNPKPDTKFYEYNGRLALFHKTNTHLEYWREYWATRYQTGLIEKAKSGDLQEFGTLIPQYVPKDLPVLEAGCGLAYFVAAMTKRGHKVTGIDNEPEVVRLVNETLPDLDVRLGDVLSLDFPNQSIGCYISLGVVEHFQNGPSAALIQARRVLHPDGVALISVPYLNPARKKLFSQISQFDNQRDTLNFHQYYFSLEDFQSELRKAGLKGVVYYPYAVSAFLTREHPLFFSFWHSFLCRTRIRKLFSLFLGEPRFGLEKDMGIWCSPFVDLSSVNDFDRL